jgi:hypothetical protein
MSSNTPISSTQRMINEHTPESLVSYINVQNQTQEPVEIPLETTIPLIAPRSLLAAFNAAGINDSYENFNEIVESTTSADFFIVPRSLFNDNRENQS